MVDFEGQNLQILKINAEYQFYVPRGEPIDLSIVLYNGKPNSKHWEQARVAFILYKSGDKRPIAMVLTIGKNKKGTR